MAMNVIHVFLFVFCCRYIQLQFKLLKYHTHSINGFNEANTQTQTSSFTSEKIKIPNEIRFLILLVPFLDCESSSLIHIGGTFDFTFISIQFAWCKPKSGWQRMKDEEMPMNPAIKSLFAWKHRYKCPYSANILNQRSINTYMLFIIVTWQIANGTRKTAMNEWYYGILFP